MASILDTSLNLAAPPTEAERSLLGDLQGNILKWHGRKHMRLFLIRFPDREGGAKLIASVRPRVLSALAELTAGRGYGDRQPGAGSLVTLSLTAAGYETLGQQPPDALRTADAPPPQGDRVNSDPSSRAALEAAYERDADAWIKVRAAVADVEQRHVHAIVMLAAGQYVADEASVEFAAHDLANAMRPFADIVCIETGMALEPGGFSVEPFGYRDGLGGPHLLGSNAVPLSTLLVRDPSGREGNHFGSFLAYRKIRQQPDRFQYEKDRLPDGLTDDQRGALIIGRFRDGTPTNHSGLPDDRADLQASEPPVFGGDDSFVGHAQAARAESENHPIVRRGMPFGAGTGSIGGWGGPAPAASSPIVGLQFLAYTADLDHFEAIAEAVERNATVDLGNYTEPLGTVYAFTPSLTGLDNLCAPARAADLAAQLGLEDERISLLADALSPVARGSGGSVVASERPARPVVPAVSDDKKVALEAGLAAAEKSRALLQRRLDEERRRR